MDANEGAVGRQPAATLGPLAAHPGGLRVAVELAGRFIPDRDEDPIVLVGGEAGGDASVDQRDAHHPSVMEASEEGSRIASLEGRQHPAALLVADLVVPPHDARSVGEDVRLLRAHATVRRSPPLIRSEVPGPSLCAAILGGDRRQVVRGLRCPRHLLDRRMGEAEGPARPRIHRRRGYVSAWAGARDGEPEGT
jgi:hypothetical protein